MNAEIVANFKVNWLYMLSYPQSTINYELALIYILHQLVSTNTNILALRISRYYTNCLGLRYSLSGSTKITNSLLFVPFFPDKSLNFILWQIDNKKPRKKFLYKNCIVFSIKRSKCSKIHKSQLISQEPKNSKFRSNRTTDFH